VRSLICAREGRERLQGSRIPWCGADEASIQPGGHTNREPSKYRYDLELSGDPKDTSEIMMVRRKDIEPRLR